MRQLIALLILLFTTSVYSAEGIVLAHAVPLFKEKSKDSPVVQYVRKGEKIFISQKDLPKRDIEIDYEQSDYYESRNFTTLLHEQERTPKNMLPSEFYLTLDRNGNEVYVEAKYIKINYRDMREKQKDVSIGKHDPTDYRLEEPLPPHYPLKTPRSTRFFIEGGMGYQRKYNYPYRRQIHQINHRQSQSLNMAYINRIEFDQYNRLYFGPQILLKGGTTEITNKDESTASEQRGVISVGPYLSFDNYRTEKWTMTIFGSMTFDYHRAIVTQSDDRDQIEERDFSAFWFSGHTGSHLQYHFKEDFDLITSLQADLYPSLSMKSSSPRYINGVWREGSEDTLTSPMAPEFSLYLGIQLRQ